MEKENNWEYLDELLLLNPPILYLGAGFSYDAVSEKYPEDINGLKELILDKLFKNDNDYEELSKMTLRDLCEEADILGRKEELTTVLTDCFKNLNVSEKNTYYLRLVDYPWKLIYSSNIDDLIEHIYHRAKKEINVWRGKCPQPQNNENTTLVKLHGCVNYPQDGYIFSRSEYTELISLKLDAKLNNFTSDLISKNVVFVGTCFDEPDIEYYLSMYEKAGYTKTNKIVFVDPKPTRILRSRIRKLDAKLITATAEEFINHVANLEFNPDKIEKAKIQLNYNGVFRLSDIEKMYETPYDSKLYQGYNCEWQDVSEEWTYDDVNYYEAKKELEDLLKDTTSNNHCYSIYGRFYSGKSCLLKKLAYYLSTKGYEILEYKGTRFNYTSIINYFKISVSKKIALIVDNASHYYEQIERLLLEQLYEKEIVIITASREYYHKRKRYYLDGNSFIDHKQNDIFSRKDALNIRNTLQKKTRLSYMTAMNNTEQVGEIFRLRSISNLIVGLSYGGAIKNAKISYNNSLRGLSKYENRLLTEIAILDEIDFEYYPRELFIERYGSTINFDDDKELSRLIDFVRFDDIGLSLNNSIIREEIIKNVSQKSQNILDILDSISNKVYEEEKSTWYILFQCLLKVETLEKRLRLRESDIKKIFLELKTKYGDISYFWLQFGLFEQSQKDYITALGYLEKAASIRPKAFKIQHAIARNYMRYANSIDDYDRAKALFEDGEIKMKELIESNNIVEKKARPFSISCYVSEKVRFLDKFKRIQIPSKNDLRYMWRIMDQVNPDDYMKTVFKGYYNLLESLGELSVIRISSQSPYFKYMGNENCDEFEDEQVELFD